VYRTRGLDSSYPAWDRVASHIGPVRVIFDGFSGDCRLADVRFYPVSVQPGPARKRCVSPDRCRKTALSPEARVNAACRPWL
jgi:hypothetical protein